MILSKEQKIMVKKLMIILGVVLSTSVFAEPTTESLKIIKIRPYNGPTKGAVYLHMEKDSVCDTSVYKVDLSKVGSKEIVSAAFTAFSMNLPVRIEVDNAGCTGWGTLVQSLYLER